jgi:hypothetical protein
MEKTVKAFEGLQKDLEEYRKKGSYNVLVPTLTIQEISPFHKPVLEIVSINSDPKAGEVYQIIPGSDDFSLRATALLKIGYAAGLIWNAKGSGRTDDGSDPNIITYRAEAAVRKEDGTYMPMNAEYMVDLKVIEEEITGQYEKKAKKLASENKWTEEQKKNYIHENLNRDMLQKRKFRLQLAQTGAMDRVIRKILALKSSYKKAELDKPFVVPKIAFHPDVTDPEVRKALLRQGLDASLALFGPPGESLIERAALPEKCDAIDVTPTETGAKTEPPQKEIPFAEMDEAAQIKHLEALIERKGYDQAKMKKPISEFTETERAKFKDHLDPMPDKKVEELPFS